MEIRRELQQCVILSLDILSGDLLLDHLLTPVFVEPGMGDFLLIGVSEEERILLTYDVQVDLEVDDMIVKGSHWY